MIGPRFEMPFVFQGSLATDNHQAHSLHQYLLWHDVCTLRAVQIS